MGRVKDGRGTLLGNAGEHYVAAELLRRDIITALAPRNAPGIDLLATSGPRSVNIRVKTMSHEAGDWVWMARRDGRIFPNLQEELDFVVLVGIARDEPPAYWILPTPVLDAELRRHHTAWLGTPGRGGRAHKDTPMRRIGHTTHDKDWLIPYRDRWDLVRDALGAARHSRPPN